MKGDNVAGSVARIVTIQGVIYIFIPQLDGRKL